MVPLSNVKRLFRSRFQTELSETMLGHSKLSELLQDDRFGDICMVQLQGHGYIVMQVEPQENQTICLADTLPVYGGDTPASEPRRVEFFPEQPSGIPLQALPDFCSEEPLTLDMDEAGVFVESSPSPKGKARWPPAFSPNTDGFVGSLVQRTFIHASPPPPTPPPNARRRSKSLPKDVGSDRSLLEAHCESLRLVSRQSGQLRENTESTIDSAGSAVDANMRPPSSPAPSAELSQSCRSDQSPGPALDDPVKVLLRECNLNSGEPLKLGETAPSDVLDFGHTEDAEPRRRLLFCPDEPLALEEAGVFLETAPRTQTPTNAYSHPSATRWPYLSPSLVVKDGKVGSMPLSKVQNTFIHSPLPPPTPLRVGASRRSQSLPKNVGSDKNAWEATCQALGCTQAVMDVQNERTFSAGDCGPTPSWDRVYADYLGPNMPCSLTSSPAFVPPSPALTASPTYCSTRQLGLGTYGVQRPPHPAQAPGFQSPQSNRSLPPTPESRFNVLCLADLLQ
jgi:hypothetical protein